MAYLTDDTRYGINKRHLTKALFMELSESPDVYPPLFTLKDYDHNGFPSLYKLYMQYDSEYEAALQILGSWPHWKELCKCSWFKPYRNTWEAERLERDKAVAKKQLLNSALEGNVTAQRILYGTPPDEAKRKRATTKKENEAAETLSHEDKLLEEAFKQSPISKAH